MGKVRVRSLRDVEREVRSILEEIELRKKGIEELEKREKELWSRLEKLRFPKGTFIPKYVRCGRKKCKSCPHGPYYYLVWKERGKTKWKYVGKVLDALEARKRPRLRR